MFKTSKFIPPSRSWTIQATWSPTLWYRRINCWCFDGNVNVLKCLHIDVWILIRGDNTNTHHDQQFGVERSCFDSVSNVIMKRSNASSSAQQAVMESIEQQLSDSQDYEWWNERWSSLTLMSLLAFKAVFTFSSNTINLGRIFCHRRKQHKQMISNLLKFYT